MIVTLRWRNTWGVRMAGVIVGPVIVAVVAVVEVAVIVVRMRATVRRIRWTEISPGERR